MKLISFSILMLLSSCMISMNQIHTEGSATDVVDEQQDSEPTVSPTISLPVKAL